MLTLSTSKPTPMPDLTTHNVLHRNGADDDGQQRREGTDDGGDDGNDLIGSMSLRDDGDDTPVSSAGSETNWTWSADGSRDVGVRCSRPRSVTTTTTRRSRCPRARR